MLDSLLIRLLFAQGVSRVDPRSGGGTTAAAVGPTKTVVRVCSAARLRRAGTSGGLTAHAYHLVVLAANFRFRAFKVCQLLLQVNQLVFLLLQDDE